MRNIAESIIVIAAIFLFMGVLAAGFYSLLYQIGAVA
jgi:hypothetical protein